MNKDYYVAYCDGSCEPINPGGDIGLGAFILNPDRKKIYDLSEIISAYHFDGKTSNNVAEYLSIIRVLEFLIDEGLKDEKIIICGDSQLTMFQLSGKWGCNGGIYEEYYHIAKEFRDEFSNISFEWIPRDKNTIADELSKKR